METMTEVGTEKRVDELSKRVDSGFAQVDKRIDDFQGETRERFNRAEGDIRELRSDMKTGFDSLNQLTIRACAGTIGSIIASVIVLLLSHS
jgi:hypothetical protein